MKRVIIDCDPGIDDSLAILYALKSPNLKVEAITVGFGNTTLEQGTRNALALIRLSGCSDAVPVFRGASCPLNGEAPETRADIHGGNGVAGMSLPAPAQQAETLPAWDAIIKMANDAPGEITLITLGRMTNLAYALEKDPSLSYKLKDVVAMGGCYRFEGNVTAYAEANIYGDAHAARRCFERLPHLTLVGLNVTTKTRFTRAHLETLNRAKNESNAELFDYIHSALEFYFNHYARMSGYDHACAVHDPLAVLIAEDPSLGKYSMIHATVEDADGVYRGMIAADTRFGAPMHDSTILFADSVDSKRAVDRFWKIMMDR